MKTASAWDRRTGERSAHKIAEKMAKSAGIDFDDWIAEAVAEYAEDLGVEPEDLSERERLEAIEDRIDRLARAPSARSPRDADEDEIRPSRSPETGARLANHRESPPRRSDSRRPERVEEPRQDARRPQQRIDYVEETGPDRLEQAIRQIEQRAARNEERTARALESMTGLVEARAGERGRLDETIEKIEQRAVRNEARTARALESLAGLVDTHGGESGKLDEAIAGIEQRAARNEARTARALESLSGLVQAGGDEREKLQESIAKIEARAETSAQRTAATLEKVASLVETRGRERERLEAAIARVGQRAEESEARAARALESMSSLARTPPAAPAPAREDPLATRFSQLSRRAARAPEPAAGEDDETFRLVSERLARRRNKGAGVEPPPVTPPAPQGKNSDALDASVGEMQRELRRLADKVETLTAPPQEKDSAAIGQAVAERLERRIADLAERMETLGAPAPAEFEQAIKSLNDARGEIERGASAAVLQTVERRLDELGARVEAAARRPAVDPRPFEDLSQRVETIRATIERQGARPDAAVLAAALRTLDEKLDRASATGVQSAAATTALQGMVARLEAALQRPTTASIDARPIEELSRRIEGVRGLVERQGGLAPKVDKLNAAVGALAQKFERPAATVAEIEKLESALLHLSAQVETSLARSGAVDAKPVEDLARRIDAVRKAVESNGALAPQVNRLESALGEIRAKLDRPPQSPQIEAVDASLRNLAAKFEQAVNRPTAFDTKPIEELSRRIDSMKGAVDRQEKFAPHAARVEAALGEIRARLDQTGDAQSVDLALRDLAARLDEAVNRPATISLDPKPIEDLARRIESVRESLENPALSPQAERLESALGAVADKLDSANIVDANGINSTLAAMNARLEEAFRRPPEIAALSERVEAVRESVARHAEQLDVVGRPFDELAKRLDGLREIVERQAGQLDAGRLEQAFRGAVADFERPGLAAQDIASLIAAIEALAAKVEQGARPSDLSHIEAALAHVVERLERQDGLHDSGGSDLVAVADALAELSAKIERAAPPFDGRRLETMLTQVAERLNRPGVERSDVANLAEAIADLDGKLDRVGGHRPSLLDDLLHDIAIRLEGLETKLDSRASEFRPADEGLAHVELAVRELTEKLGELRAAADTRAVEQEMRVLQDKVDDLADARLSGATVEQTAQAIAREVGERLTAASPEAMLGHLQDIHDRLDVIGASRPAPAALEQAMRELTEELDAFRSAREAVGRGAATLSEMRTEQLQFDRRMDARFSGVQDILEKLVDRLGRLDSETVADAPRPSPAPRGTPSFAPRSAMQDIPERGQTESRSQPPLVADMAPLAPPARVRESGDASNAKSAAINTHIAAARRAANAASAEVDRRDEGEASRKAAASGGFARRAQDLFNRHRRPALLGAAGLMTLLTGVAVLELRGARPPERRSELDAPATLATPLAQAEPARKDALSTAFDPMPTGAIGGAPKVISAPLPPPGVAAPRTGPKPPADLVAALPTGVGSALAAAASAGDVGAQVDIAQRYLEGRTVPRDPKTAAAWMQSAADAGNAFALYRLGALYEKGSGVTRDAQKAKELYKKAADAGNARAMHNLAVLFAQDGGAGKPDYASAMDWFHRAADYGVRDSQFNLGVLHGRGLGSTQDLAQSWMWFSLAAKQGDTDAARKRDEVSNRMDGKAMAQAKTLLEAFKAKTPDPAVNDPPPAPATAAADAPAAPPSDKAGSKS